MTHGFLWDLLAVFFLVMYFMLLWFILIDMFSDHELSGWWKTLWIIALIFIPFLTILIYLIARGPGMQKRAQAKAVAYQQAQDAYIKQVAGGSAAEIEKANSLLKSGAITQEEYDKLKAQALNS